jgi:hypothetical protein
VSGDRIRQTAFLISNLLSYNRPTTLTKFSTCRTRCLLYIYSRDSSVGIALGYGLDDWGSRVRFPAEAGNFSHRVQNDSAAHSASYPMGTRVSFPGGKAVGA